MQQPWCWFQHCKLCEGCARCRASTCSVELQFHTHTRCRARAASCRHLCGSSERSPSPWWCCIFTGRTKRSISSRAGERAVVADHGVTEDNNHRGPVLRPGFVLRLHGDHQAHAETQQRRLQWNGEQRRLAVSSEAIVLSPAATRLWTICGTGDPLSHIRGRDGCFTLIHDRPDKGAHLSSPARMLNIAHLSVTLRTHGTHVS